MDKCDEKVQDTLRKSCRRTLFRLWGPERLRPKLGASQPKRAGSPGRGHSVSKGHGVGRRLENLRNCEKGSTQGDRDAGRQRPDGIRSVVQCVPLSWHHLCILKIVASQWKKSGRYYVDQIIKVNTSSGIKSHSTPPGKMHWEGHNVISLVSLPKPA